MKNPKTWTIGRRKLRPESCWQCDSPALSARAVCEQHAREVYERAAQIRKHREAA